eukprot:Opistho-2@88791
MASPLRPPPLTQRRTYRALYPFTASDATELSCSTGDIFTEVSPPQSEWLQLRCERTGREGLLPGNYLEQIASPAPANSVASTSPGGSGLAYLRLKHTLTREFWCAHWGADTPRADWSDFWDCVLVDTPSARPAAQAVKSVLDPDGDGYVSMVRLNSITASASATASLGSLLANYGNSEKPTAHVASPTAPSLGSLAMGSPAAVATARFTDDAPPPYVEAVRTAPPMPVTPTNAPMPPGYDYAVRPGVSYGMPPYPPASPQGYPTQATPVAGGYYPTGVQYSFPGPPVVLQPLPEFPGGINVGDAMECLEQSSIPLPNGNKMGGTKWWPCRIMRIDPSRVGRNIFIDYASYENSEWSHWTSPEFLRPVQGPSPASIPCRVGDAVEGRIGNRQTYMWWPGVVTRVDASGVTIRFQTNSGTTDTLTIARKDVRIGHDAKWRPSYSMH